MSKFTNWNTIECEDADGDETEEDDFEFEDDDYYDEFGEDVESEEDLEDETEELKTITH